MIWSPHTDLDFFRPRNPPPPVAPQNVELCCIWDLVQSVEQPCGGLEPTIKVGAPGIVAPLKVKMDAPVLGRGCVENGICAAENALRKTSISGFDGSGIVIPNTIVLERLSAPGATCHLASTNICESCIAKTSASGSPPVYRRLTRPGFASSAVFNLEAESGDRDRQATICFICSVCNRASAASLSSWTAFNWAVAAPSSAVEAMARASLIRTLASLVTTSDILYPTIAEKNAAIRPTPPNKAAEAVTQKNTNSQVREWPTKPHGNTPVGFLCVVVIDPVVHCCIYFLPL